MEIWPVSGPYRAEVTNLTDQRKITGVILAGGSSERFGGAGARPKPAIKIAGTPLVLHAAAGLVRAGCTRIVVLTGRNQDQLQSELGLSSRFGQFDIGDQTSVSFELRFSGHDAATGGRLAHLRKDELGDDALITYTDVFSDCDLRTLLCHRQKTESSLAMLAVNPQQPWGLITLDQDRIAAFHEKPVVQDQWINGGIFATDASLLDAIKDPEDRLEDQVVQRLISQNKAVALRHRGW